MQTWERFYAIGGVLLIDVCHIWLSEALWTRNSFVNTYAFYLVFSFRGDEQPLENYSRSRKNVVLVRSWDGLLGYAVRTFFCRSRVLSAKGVWFVLTRQGGWALTVFCVRLCLHILWLFLLKPSVYFRFFEPVLVL